MLITCPKCSAKYQIPSEIRLVEGKKVQCSACQHIFEFSPSVSKEDFTKEKRLLVPEDAVLSIVSKTKEITLQKITPSELNSSGELVSLPEVFVPIQEQAPPQQPPYFWIILCSLLLLGLTFIGWLYRDSLWMDVYKIPPLVREKMIPVKTSKRREVIHPYSKAVEKPVVITPDIPLDLDEIPEQKEDGAVAVLPQGSASALSIQSVRFRKTTTNGAILIEGILKNTSPEPVVLPEKIYALAYGTDGTILFEKEIYLSAGVLPSGAEQAFFGTHTPLVEGVQWIDVVLEK